MKKYSCLLLLCMGMALASVAQTAIDTNKWQLIVRGTDSMWMQKPSKADQLVQAGDYAGAVGAFRQQLKEGDTEPATMYNLACAYSVLNNKDSAFFFLQMALEYDSSIYALTDPDFINLITDPRWKKIEDRQLDLQYAKGSRYRQLKLTKELLRMGIRDQAYYTQINHAEDKYGMQNPVSDSLWKLKETLNDENLKRLEQIIADYGWPGSSAVGRRAAQIAFLIVQHSNLEMQKKYKPMLMAACDRKDAEWSSLALLIDRIEVNEKRPQIYGSQVRYDKEKKVYEPFPIIDEHNLDKRRKDAGLRSAASYYANWDIDYKVEQNK